MKKNNKGFSLVELIIVIAIMAILAGALAPALIKYINKSRRSADISNGDTIRTAIQTALSNEDAINGFTDVTTKDTISNIISKNKSFGDELSEILGSTTLKSKYFSKGSEFSATIEVSANKVVVYAGDCQVSPEASK